MAGSDSDRQVEERLAARQERFAGGFRHSPNGNLTTCWGGRRVTVFTHRYRAGHPTGYKWVINLEEGEQWFSDDVFEEAAEAVDDAWTVLCDHGFDTPLDLPLLPPAKMSKAERERLMAVFARIAAKPK